MQASVHHCAFRSLGLLEWIDGSVACEESLHMTSIFPFIDFYELEAPLLPLGLPNVVESYPDACEQEKTKRIFFEIMSRATTTRAHSGSRRK
jgi:hypothetical protein